jgi:hypothetical protein
LHRQQTGHVVNRRLPAHRRIQPILNFGMQAGVVGAQQSHREQNKMLLLQEQLACPQPLSAQFQGIAIMRQRGVVPALKERHCALHRLHVVVGHRPFGRRQRFANIVQTEREQIAPR